MRFLADMGISPKVVALLREQNHDAVHLAEENLQKLPDEEILLKAKLEKRVILTVDLDFAYLLAVSNTDLPSVILFRLNNASREVMETRLQEVIKICSLDLLEGAIISVSNDSFRVRCLPLFQ